MLCNHLEYDCQLLPVNYEWRHFGNVQLNLKQTWTMSVWMINVDKDTAHTDKGITEKSQKVQQPDILS